MNSEQEDAEVRQFYVDATMPEDRVDALLAHGHSIADARFWKRVAGATAIGFVAMTILSVILLVRSGEGSAPSVNSMIAGDSEGPASMPSNPKVPAVTPPVVAPVAPGGIIQLVAVRSHGDRCPHCRNSGERFAELRESWRGEPIEFTMIDLRRGSEDFERSQRTFDSLHLDELVQGSDKALIALSDQAGNLHRLDASLSTEQLAREITDLIGAK